MKDLTAEDVMVRNVQSVEADWSLVQLRDFLMDKGVSGAPVLDGNRLVGVVSATDWIQAATGEQGGTELAFYRDTQFVSRGSKASVRALHIEDNSSARVRDIMSSSVLAVQPHTAISEVASLMAGGLVHRILVTREDKLVGIISALDLVKLLAKAKT
jgi:CBS-domain-containing membrane protein